MCKPGAVVQLLPCLAFFSSLSLYHSLFFVSLAFLVAKQRASERESQESKHSKFRCFCAAFAAARFCQYFTKTFASQKSIVCHEPTAAFPLHFPHTYTHARTHTCTHIYFCISFIVLTNLFLLLFLCALALGFPCTLRFRIVIRIKRTTLCGCVCLLACTCACVCEFVCVCMLPQSASQSVLLGAALPRPRQARRGFSLRSQLRQLRTCCWSAPVAVCVFIAAVHDIQIYSWCTYTQIQTRINI